MTRTICRSIFLFSITFLGGIGVVYGQATSSKDVNVVNTPAVNVVNAPTVGVDPSRNVVRLPNTETDPLAVRLVGAPVRRPFQMGVNLEIVPGASSDSVRLPIPIGKRLVIEDVSAITFQPAGQGVWLSFTTSVDDGLAVDDQNEDEVHSLVLVSQGVFGSFERSTAHEKATIFADESIQTNSKIRNGLVINATLSRFGGSGTAGVRITFSGYIEDLPVPTLAR